MPKDRPLREIDEQLGGRSAVVGSTTTRSSTGITDHGQLTGLTDDDHGQYLTNARHDAIDAADHGSGSATDGQMLTADGSGGAAWEALADHDHSGDAGDGGQIAGVSALSDVDTDTYNDSAAKVLGTDADGGTRVDHLEVGNVTGATEGVVSAATSINAGRDDASSGTLRLYGNGTGSDEGGQINLYMAADHDTTYNSWFIDVYQDDLRIGPSGAVRLLLASDGAVVFGNDSYPIRQPFIARLYPLRFADIQAATTGLTATSWTSIGGIIQSGATFFGNGMPSIPTGHQRRWYLSVNWADDCQTGENASLQIIRASDSAVMGGPWDLPYRWASVSYNNHTLIGPFYNADTNHWRLQYKVASGRTLWLWDVTAQVVLETT